MSIYYYKSSLLLVRECHPEKIWQKKKFILGLIISKMESKYTVPVIQNVA